MITYTRQSKFDVYAYTKTDELTVARYELKSWRGHSVNEANESDHITKHEFLAFVREHHDADTVEFVEKWIAKREPKPMEPFRREWFEIEPKNDGVLAFSIGGGCVRLGLDGQQEMADYLYENLKRHGVEVGT